MNSFTNVVQIVSKLNNAWVTVLRASGFITPHNESSILLAVEKEFSKEDTL